MLAGVVGVGEVGGGGVQEGSLPWQQLAVKVSQSVMAGVRDRA